MSLRHYLHLLLAASVIYICFGPPNPAAAAPPISAYGELPGFERAALSPSGARIALVATVKADRLLIMIEDGKILKRVSLGDIKVRDIEWANNDLLLLDASTTEKLFGFTTDKAEFYRTYIIGTGTEPPALLFAQQKDIADATFGWFGVREVEGKSYGFFGGVPLAKYTTGTNMAEYVYEGGSPAVYKVNLATLSADAVGSRPADGKSNDYLIDANGKLAAKMELVAQSGSWKILNAKGDTIATGVNPLGGIGLTAFGKNGETVIFHREDEQDQSHALFEVPLAGGEAVQFLPGVEVDRLYIDRRTGVVMGYLESGPAAKSHFFDPIHDKRMKKIAKAFPNVRRYISDWTPDLSKVLLSTNGNKDSGSWWAIDLLSNAASQAGAERPLIGPDDVGPISTVAYKAVDGLEMDGILTLPSESEAKNLPVIMLPHGGPTAHDEEGFDWWAQAFASRGYAVFQPNFRGSTNRDAAFIKAGHGEWGRKMQTDISDGLAHLASQGIVDPKRACIVGASYGGYAALAGITLQKGIYRCAVSVAGVADLSMMVSSDVVESGSDPMLRRNLKVEIGSGRELKDVSPRRFAAQTDAPVLLIHGKDDTVVPYKQSKVMADALKEAGKPFEFVTLEGEDHWLSKSDTRLKMLQATVAFVEKHNPAN